VALRVGVSVADAVVLGVLVPDGVIETEAVALRVTLGVWLDVAVTLLVIDELGVLLAVHVPEAERD